MAGKDAPLTPVSNLKTKLSRKKAAETPNEAPKETSKNVEETAEAVEAAPHAPSMAKRLASFPGKFRSPKSSDAPVEQPPVATSEPVPQASCADQATPEAAEDPAAPVKEADNGAPDSKVGFIRRLMPAKKAAEPEAAAAAAAAATGATAATAAPAHPQEPTSTLSDATSVSSSHAEGKKGGLLGRVTGFLPGGSKKAAPAPVKEDVPASAQAEASPEVTEVVAPVDPPAEPKPSLVQTLKAKLARPHATPPTETPPAVEAEPSAPHQSFIQKLKSNLVSKDAPPASEPAETTSTTEAPPATPAEPVKETAALVLPTVQSEVTSGAAPRNKRFSIANVLKRAENKAPTDAAASPKGGILGKLSHAKSDEVKTEKEIVDEKHSVVHKASQKLKSVIAGDKTGEKTKAEPSEKPKVEPVVASTPLAA